VDKPPSSLYEIDEVLAFTLFKEISMLAIKILVALLLSSCDYRILFSGIEKKIENFRFLYPLTIGYESVQRVTRKL